MFFPKPKREIAGSHLVGSAKIINRRGTPVLIVPDKAKTFTATGKALNSDTLQSSQNRKWLGDNDFCVRSY